MSVDEHFAAMDGLGEHLMKVKPVFDSFCVRNGFVYVPRLAIGRYPRIRIAREGITNLYFDLWMDLDESGHRFEEFNEDLPYSLYAGASIVEDNGSKYGVRYSLDFTCFSNTPFNQVGGILLSEIETHLRLLEGLEVKHIKEKGSRVLLGS